MADRPIVLAVVAGAHGIGGEVRLKLFAEDAVTLKGYSGLMLGGRSVTLKSIRAGSNGAVARFAEIADRTAAEGLRGTELTVARDSLPPLAEGEYYHADLLRLPVVSTTGEAVGVLVAIENFGAGDVIEVEKPGGKLFMAPIAAVTIEPERLVIDPAFVD